MMVKENNQFDQRELNVQRAVGGGRCAATDGKQQRATATEMRRTR